MYWFNIQEILEQADEPLTTTQIYLQYLEEYGKCNRNRIVIILKKLVVAGIVEAREDNIPHQRGTIFYYELKK